MSTSSPIFRKNIARRLLVFGFLLTLLSGFGQTFFIGLFSVELRESLELSDGAFGMAYSFATLTSAICMLWAGGLIDRIAVPLYAAGSVGVLAAGYLLLPLAGNVFLLMIVLFLLRFGGQGLLSHTAVTSIAGFFGRARGKALSFALLGHPIGEAILPSITVLLATTAGWRFVWILTATLLLLTCPLLLYLGSGTSAPTTHQGITDNVKEVIQRRSHDGSRGDVLRDRRFYLLLPTLLTPGFVLTGLFIHQSRLMEQKGWDLSWFAASFVIFAATQAVGMLSVGSLIDRLTGTRLMPFYLVPLGLACVALSLSNDSLVLIPFMAGAGLTAGVGTSIVTAMWAETYGLTHLGAIRALGTSGMIFSTALSPPLFGWLIEHGARVVSILIVCAISIAIASTLARIATKSKARNPLRLS
ncbi:MFS transporter [Nitrospira sp. T9]|uniref:MFS transporter n=1 Tax=unclassified Nitrospira TaxID=2652172 RepID=UPI003F9D72CE